MSEHDLVESEVTTRDKNSQVVRMQEIKILSDGSKVKSSITRQLSWWTDRDGIFLHSAPTKLSKIISKHRDAILPHVERGREHKTPFWRRGHKLPNVIDRSEAATKITQLSPTETKVEMIIAPHLLDRAHALPANRDFRTLDRMQKKFQNWRKLDSLDETDGEVMGKMLMANCSGLLSKHRTNQKLKESRVQLFFEEFHAMRAMKVEQPFIEKLIQAVVVGGGGGNENEISEKKFAMLEVGDGSILGASFVKHLNVAATEEGAFASWVKKHPAMNELSLSTKYIFFKPLLLTTGKVVRHTTTWTKMAKSIGAALMSMLDIGSDVYTIKIYRSRNAIKTADLMTFFVLVSLILQIMLTIAVHHKNKWTTLKELVGTLTFVKPAFNKVRAERSGAERSEAQRSEAEAEAEPCLKKEFGKKWKITILKLTRFAPSSAFSQTLKWRATPSCHP